MFLSNQFLWNGGRGTMKLLPLKIMVYCTFECSRCTPISCLLRSTLAVYSAFLHFYPSQITWGIREMNVPAWWNKKSNIKDFLLSWHSLMTCLLYVFFWAKRTSHEELMTYDVVFLLTCACNFIKLFFRTKKEPHHYLFISSAFVRRLYKTHMDLNPN